MGLFLGKWGKGTVADTIKDSETSIGYMETQDNLSIRIRANKTFSNFNLEDWIDKHLPFKKGDIIFDIGCGNGNLFPSYSAKLEESGVIIGIDKSKELLSEAMKRKVETPKVLLEWNMDDRFPFLENSFNYVISSFAIYYISDVSAIVEDINRVLKHSGEVFLIGPTDNNAKELYDFNKKVFGFGRDETIDRRTNRLEKEFYPVMKGVLENVAINKILSKLIFPDKEEFIKYYMATLLFEESLKKTGLNLHAEDLLSIDISSLEISKEMISLQGKKND